MRLACGRDSPRRRRHRHGADRQRAGPPGHGLFPSVRDHLPLKDSGLQRPQFFASGFGHSAPFRDSTPPQRKDPSRCKPRAIAMQLFTYAAANAPKAVDPFAQVLVLIACSATKIETPNSVPLHRLYNGLLWHTLRLHRARQRGSVHSW
jgi:hypothetical protein